MMMPEHSHVAHIHLPLQNHIRDGEGEQVRDHTRNFLHIDTGDVRSGKIFTVCYDLPPQQVREFAHACLEDPIVNIAYINEFCTPPRYRSYILVAKLPGVTDDEGISAQKTLADFLNISFDTTTQHIFSKELFLLEASLSLPELQCIAEKLLGNPLIHHFEYGQFDTPGRLADKTRKALQYTPEVHISTHEHAEPINIFVDDDTLQALSKAMVLSLNLEEMRAIQHYYREPQVKARRSEIGLPTLPTDCEIEIIAQTWSEHCKHKEFNALIHYKNHDSGEQKTIDSLFKTYIKGSTDIVKQHLEANGNTWLVKVFSDNAGIVQITPEQLFVWKVETHNSPSAIDPYGGAITGILGNNRDPLGTGVGGAKLLFNTNVLCFGPLHYDRPILTGQLPPRRVFEGVRKGIEDGGNKSGIPTVNGAIVFDDRYAGKPLVYCGTGGLLPCKYQGRNTWEKRIDAGDYIIMAGGRVGKDGIHGATFSSVEIDEYSPQSAVQIGSPITQKLLSDFLERACRAGLVKCSTDNGAGGLSSSIGELASISHGAVVNLEAVPLKYSGLKPWEIFVSESQERMTLVIEDAHLDDLFRMATEMEVELSKIGRFTSEGILDVRYKGEPLAYLDLDFLHNAVPRKTLEAEWHGPELDEPELDEPDTYNDILLRLLARPNICSREQVIRQYDHEVKGKTIIKPLMGAQGKAPQDAAVMRLDFDSYAGIAISNGILPRYGDLDPYQMSAGAFDEAVRQIIAVGGKLPNCSPQDGICWTVNDNFCVPDSVYDPVNNPDGKQKLARLVQMCEALYDMATLFDIPMTSGKDSMKNDFKADGQKISVPPTILYSMVATIDDVRTTRTSEFKAAGDLIYQLGSTYEELGGSEFYALFGKLGANVPKVRAEQAKALYQKVMQAHEQGLLESCHDLSDGGLAVAVAEAAFGAELGAELDVSAYEELSVPAILFAESHSRFVVSVRPEKQQTFECLMGENARRLGQVSKTPRLTIRAADRPLLDIETDTLLCSWEQGLKGKEM